MCDTRLPKRVRASQVRRMDDLIALLESNGWSFSGHAHGNHVSMEKGGRKVYFTKARELDRGVVGAVLRAAGIR